MYLAPIHHIGVHEKDPNYAVGLYFECLISSDDCLSDGLHRGLAFEHHCFNVD